MIKKLFFALTLLVFAFTSVTAQTKDPWITKAYNQLYGRTPSTAEYNIKNYNNGSWNSYCDLVNHIAASKGSDGWIYKAYCELYSRVPNAWELNKDLYSSGSWGNNYELLKSSITTYHNSMSSQGITVRTQTSGDKTLVAFDKGGKTFAADIVSTSTGNVIAAGGGNIVAGGAGNFNLAGIVAGGAGNFANLAGVRPSPTSLGTLSGGSYRIKTSGNGSLVVTQ